MSTPQSSESATPSVSPPVSRSHGPPGSPGLTLDDISMKGLPEGTVVGWFTSAEKRKRLLWTLVQGTLFRFSPRRADGFRAWLLRLFGAKIGRVRVLRNTVRVEIPWNVELGDGVRVGDGVYLYSLAPIRIGAETVISQFAHLCSGTHDFERLDFPLVRIPIRIGSHCWIAAEAYVAPGVEIGDGVVVGARGGVVRSLPAWTVCVGFPAKPVRHRRLVNRATGERLDPGDPTVPGDPADPLAADPVTADPARDATPANSTQNSHDNSTRSPAPGDGTPSAGTHNESGDAA